MTKDDIVIMARVAGVRDDGHRFEFSEYKYLERFTAEAYRCGVEAGAVAEREACAKLETEAGVYTKHDLAAAIRARGEQK